VRGRVELEDASALGLHPGEWPETIEYAGLEFRRRWPLKSDDGDLIAVAYLCHTGDVLVVESD
jgi:hypothetical protein